MNGNGTQRYVMVSGQVFRWEEKAPFPRSGRSILGAIEYDLKNACVKCHDCGEWFQHLGKHAKKHLYTARQYRLRYGLSLRTSLCAPGAPNASLANLRMITPEQRAKALDACRAAIQLKKSAGVKRGSNPWRHNLRNVCPDQTITRLRAVAVELGRTPTGDEVESSLRNAVYMRFESWNKGLAAAGLTITRTSDYGVPALREALRDFYFMNKRLPHCREFGHGRLPGETTYRRTFGSLKSAYQDAGLSLVADQNTGAV